VCTVGEKSKRDWGTVSEDVGGAALRTKGGQGFGYDRETAVSEGKAVLGDFSASGDEETFGCDVSAARLMLLSHLILLGLEVAALASFACNTNHASPQTHYQKNAKITTHTL
jgi:hypothetical protein